MKASFPRLVTVLTLLQAPFLQAQEPETSSSHSLSADELIAEYYLARSEGFAKINRQYLTSLEEIQKQIQSLGNLDLAILIKSEVETVKEELIRLEQKELLEIPEREPVVRKVIELESFYQAQAASDKRKLEGIKALNALYIDRSELLLKQLVKDDRIDEAKQLRDFSHEKISEMELAVSRIAAENSEGSRLGLPEGVGEFQGNYYKIYVLDRKLTREEAQALCEKSGGYLASITSKRENDFIVALRDETGATCDLWHGGESFEPDASDAVWISGEKMEFRNFKKDPSPDHHPFTVLLKKSPLWSFRANKPSAAVHGYICEWD